MFFFCNLTLFHKQLKFFIYNYLLSDKNRHYLLLLQIYLGSNSHTCVNSQPGLVFCISDLSIHIHIVKFLGSSRFTLDGIYIHTYSAIMALPELFLYLPTFSRFMFHFTS